MKLSFDRIKNMDWKQFAVNHGEKIALGVVGLLVVLILFAGTRWKTFQEKQPRELVKKVEEESQLLAAATWPETEQELFTAQYRPDEDTFTPRYDVNEVYDNTYSVVRADEFRYPPGHPMIWPLHRQQEPIEEPTWLPVRELIATAGRFILELPPEGEEALTDGALALNEEPEGPMTEEEARLEALKANDPQNGGGEEGRGFPGEGGDGGGEGFPGGDGCGGELASGEMMEGGTGEQINARGVRFVSVRGVFPFREQVEKIMEARNDPRLQNPWKLCEIVNFEIQRQKAQPGSNPWRDEDDAWETLDKSIALDLLAETVDYADDVVDYNNTHHVISSPLPMRLVGNWSAFFVGHPKIKTLTQKQIEIRRLLDKELARLEEEVKLESETGIGGFAFAQRNRQGLESELLRGEGRTKEQILRSLESALKSSMNSAEGDGEFRMPSEVNRMLSSAGEMPEYLLFRYFDYDVEPGQAYRYRVRLRLMNPNRDELPENLVAADVGQGEYRETPWSEPSPPKAMTKDSKFFVTDIRPGRGNKEPTAKIDLYQWLSEVGTTANKVIEVKLGQIIGQAAPEVDEDNPNMEPDERKMVEVLRPYQSFEPEAIELATRSAVVDLAAPPSRSPRNFHQELGVREIEPLSQALIVNEFGELENRNPLAQRKEHKTAKKFLYYEYDPWEYLKEQALAEEEYMEGYDCGELNDLEAYGGEGGMEGSSYGEAEGPRRRSRRGGANPLRRNRRGGGP